MEGYCRSCNRIVNIIESMGEYYVERKQDGTVQYHSKEDVDLYKRIPA